MAVYTTLSPEYLSRIFHEYDKDGSGFLEAGECVAALTRIGSKLKIEDIDTDGDERISEDEFMVRSPDWIEPTRSKGHARRSRSLSAPHSGSARLESGSLRRARRRAA